MDGHLMGIQSKKDGKRKRSSSEVSQTHDAKRTAKGDTIKNGPSGDMARRRQEIRRLYESYLLLSSKASKGDLRAFEHLLSRTKGSLGEQRLVSTLIPSFAANFPDKADAAVSGLIHLSRPSASWETEPALAEASCLSALEGLGTVCKAAAETSQERAVMKGAEFLLRDLSLSMSGRPDSQQRQRGSEQGRQSQEASRAKASVMTTALSAIFRTAPQKVLSACLRGLQKGHGDLFHGAKRFMSDILLRPSEADATEANRQGASTADTDSQGNCLAAEVLQSMPHVQHWITESISSSQQHAGSPLSKSTGEAGQMLTLLLQALPPVAPGSEQWPAAKPFLPISPADAREDVQPRPSPLASPFAGQREGACRPGSFSLEGFSLEASGQTDPQGQGQVLADDGSERASHVALPTVSIDPQQLQPGGDVCLASSILWLTGIPPGLSDAAIRAECSSFGTVVDVLQPTAPRDEAFVVFADIRDAACCYEAMCDAPVWGAQRSNVRFCKVPDQPSGVDGMDGKVHVWVGGVGSPRGEEGVLRRLVDEGVAAPVSILRVAGIRPGLILQYPTVSQGAKAVQALDRDAASQGRDPPASAPLSGPPLGGGSRTLWVGQVGPAVNEDRLIAALRDYGMVTGWKFLRRSNCAFIDFDTPGSAAAALEALQGANFNGSHVRIEFKDERGQSGSHSGGRGHPRGGRFPPSPGRPGWQPSHRSSGPRGDSPPVRRPRFARDNSPQLSWPPALSDQGPPSRVPVPARAFYEPHGSMSGEMKRGRSFADHSSPAQPYSARLDERLSVSSRRSGRVSKWDAPAGLADTAAEHKQETLPGPPTSLQRRSSVEEGQISMPAEPPALTSRPSSVDGGTWPRWKGMLAKSGSPVCEMICTAETSSSVRELQSWPGTLDVTVRADLSYVLSNVSAMSAVLCLAPAPQPDADRRTRQRGMFIDFINNLSSRSRAGVVQGLTAVDPVAGPRMLYLVPPSVSVAERLKVVWDHKECVFAVVMPASFS